MQQTNEDTLMTTMTNATTIAQHMIQPVAAQIVFKYDAHPKKAALGALALIHMLDSTKNATLTKEAYLQAAEYGAKTANYANNDKQQYHVTKPHGLLSIAEALGYIKLEQEMVVIQDKWLDLYNNPETMEAKTLPISRKRDERTRTHIMKSKVKPSKTMMKAVFELESTSYSVDNEQLHLVMDVRKYFTDKAHAKVMDGKFAGYANTKGYERELRNVLAEMFPEEYNFVIDGSYKMSGESELFSEYDADSRGRLYHVHCFGPNPQASDLARSLYALNNVDVVKKDTAAYQMFMEELEDISSSFWTQDNVLRHVAEKPHQALVKMLEGTTKEKAPKKPFTYIVLAKAYVEFQEKGEATVRVGFGLDAKCSGTQYLAFLAGDAEMAALCGLDTKRNKLDPYTKALNILQGMTSYADKLDRNFIKTPYMAVQYGGGTGALLGSKDFREALIALGMPKGEWFDFAEQCVMAIETAMGTQINNLKEAVAKAAIKKCKRLNKQWFTYKHTDGLVVKKPGFPQVDVSEESFAIRLEENQQVIFGKLELKDKQGNITQEAAPWTATSFEADKYEFARTFIVNFIQGLDALVARTFVKYAAEAGLKGITSIHDCFRCQLADAPKMKKVIADTYHEVFVVNNQLEHLRAELDGELGYFASNIVTDELLYNDESYYFCI